MSWEHAFLNVPTDWLDVDRGDVSPAPKMDPNRMREAMESVPAVYRLRAHGYTDADFRQLAASPDPDRRLLGETYHHLLSNSPSAQPIRADFVDGRGLVVQSGQHRVLAAQQAGVPVLPVHVAVRNREDMEKLRMACDTQVREMGLGYGSTPTSERAVQRSGTPDSSARSRGGEGWDRGALGDRFTPERVTRRSSPERGR